MCVSAVPRGFTKGWPEPPGARFGDSPPRPRQRVNSGSRSCQPWEGRAGGRPERGVGQPRGARRRPRPPTVCKRPGFGAERSAPPPAAAPCPRPEKGSPAVLRPDPSPHGSAARLGRRAGRSSQVKLLLSLCKACSSWKMPRRDGRSRRRRRLQPPAAAPLPFRFH